VNLTGAVPFGYVAGQARSAPDAVTVSGPVSATQRVQEVVVEIPVDQLTLSINNTYQPIPVDARREVVNGVKVSPPSVSVEVPVAQQVSYKEVGVRPVVRGKLASGYYLEPIELNPPSATIVGEPAQLAGVTFVETEPIEVNGLSTTSVRQVFLRAPTGATFLQPRPVSVTLRVSPIPTSQVLRVTPAAINLGPGLQLVDPPPAVELTISGPAPTLQGLSARDFRVTIDLAGRGPGQHSLTVQPQIPPSLRLESVSPSSVSVTLRPLPTPTAPAEPTAGP
jgi:YbbR domain-containing protein